MKRYFFTLTVLLLPFFSMAQLAVTFMPETQGRTLEGLMMARIMNGETQRRSVFMVIRVTEAGAGKIAETHTAAFDVNPGMNSIPASAAYNAAWSFGQHASATVVRQSHYFPEGEYEYCYELYENEKNKPGALIAEQCFDYFLEPFSPLMLTEPYDGDQICEKRPTFFWQPMLPAIPGMMYRLSLVEVKTGQAKAEALHYNMPVVQQINIPTPMLFYPPLSRELTEGKRYAWQVLATRNEMILARSEIWDFEVKCLDSVKKKPVESFRNIEDLARGNFYVAEGGLYFAVDNMHAPSDLVYTIQGISNPSEKIGKLPARKLVTGRNQVEIILDGVKGMREGNYYLLTVKLPNGETKHLRFMYKEENE